MQDFSQSNIQSFLSDAEERAASIFSYMDKSSKPSVFMVWVEPAQAPAAEGAEAQPAETPYKISILARGGFWLESADFAEFGKVLSRLSAQTLEQKQSRRVSDLPSSYTSSKSRFADVREAIFKTVNACPKKPRGAKYFVSEAAVSGGAEIFVVLGVDENFVESSPSLDIPSEPFLSRSFVLSLIDEFLEKHRIELGMPPDATEAGGFHFGIDSILYQAGRNFVSDIAYRLSGKSQPLWSEHLFSIFTQISRTSYEMGEAAGSIILAPANAEYAARSVVFSGAPRLGNIRSTRKLLELASGSMALHSDTEKVLGLGKIPRRVPKNSNCFFVDFLGSHKWRIRHGGKTLIEVSYGMPVPPRLAYNGSEVAAVIKKVFSFKGTRRAERLVELVQAAMSERKGTMLVISKKAKEEAKRMSSQSTPIAPIVLTRQLLSSLTPIDGAILLDPSGVCHCIGTILDGMVGGNGDPTRGARYNSAVKYVDSRKALGETCMAVVVSEDGNVDLIS